MIPRWRHSWPIHTRDQTADLAASIRFPLNGKSKVDPERWLLEDYLCEMVHAAQASFERAKTENVSAAERHLAARNLETAVKQLVGFVLDGICPPELKDKFRSL